MLLNEKKIFVSTGSACASSSLKGSHILKALKVEDLYSNGTIRITLGKPLSEEDIDFIIISIKESVVKLRKLSPFEGEEL